MKVKKILLFSFIIFGIFFSILIPKDVKASVNDVNYIFNKDILFNSDNIVYNESFNIRNPQIYSENYHGSYSFTNETDYSNPDDFIITEAGGSINVIPNLNGHNKILELNDTSNTLFITAINTFSNQDIGTIELWTRQNSNSDITFIVIEDGSQTDSIFFALRDNGNFGYHDGSWHDIESYSINVWYHIKIEFNTATDWHLWINGVSKDGGGGYNLRGTPTFMNRLEFTSHSISQNYIAYFDAIGYSWLSNYTINENLFPIIYVDTSIQEVDKFEFALEGINNLYDIGDSNVDGWIDIELPSGNQVFIGAGLESNDRVYLTLANVIGNIRGIKKSFNLDGQFINISLGILFPQLDGIVNSFTILIHSKDNTDITAISIKANGDLSYYDGSFHVLRNDIVIETNYDFNIFLNYELNRVYLIYSVESIITAFYDYPMSVIDKQGINEIEISTLNLDISSINSAIDYVGVYISGISQSSSYAWIQIDLIESNWNFENNNLFTILGSGMFHIGAVSGSYQVSESMRLVKTMNNYNNISQFYNIYDNYISNIVNPFLILTLINNNFSFNSLNIEGVKLTEGSNEYWLKYTHSNILTNESYFYVDNNNRLQFNHIANDTNLEYIQAKFNITDISSDDYAIKFRSNINYNAYGYVRVNFTYISNFIPLPIYDTTSRFFITQNKTINSFIILITDDDIDSIIGLTEGYISEISLLYVSGISISITTSSLLLLMIPIIMIFVPTFILTQGTKYKNMIVPLMMLMSSILVINEIIPYWLFFTIIFPSVIFIFLKRKEGFL